MRARVSLISFEIFWYCTHSLVPFGTICNGSPQTKNSDSNECMYGFLCAPRPLPANTYRVGVEHTSLGPLLRRWRTIWHFSFRHLGCHPVFKSGFFKVKYSTDQYLKLCGTSRNDVFLRSKLFIKFHLQYWEISYSLLNYATIMWNRSVSLGPTHMYNIKSNIYKVRII